MQLNATSPEITGTRPSARLTAQTWDSPQQLARQRRRARLRVAFQAFATMVHCSLLLALCTHHGAVVHDTHVCVGGRHARRVRRARVVEAPVSRVCPCLNWGVWTRCGTR